MLQLFLSKYLGIEQQTMHDLEFIQVQPSITKNSSYILCHSSLFSRSKLLYMPNLFEQTSSFYCSFTEEKPVTSSSITAYHLAWYETFDQKSTGCTYEWFGLYICTFTDLRSSHSVFITTSPWNNKRTWNLQQTKFTSRIEHCARTNFVKRSSGRQMFCVRQCKIV